MESIESTTTRDGITNNFIDDIIAKDIAEQKYKSIATRFPPEPNGLLHIGHAKSIILNYTLAMKYNGSFNLRFDDTNPSKEKVEFLSEIETDVRWLGADFGNKIYYASDYFSQMYDAAEVLIKKGLAYVCDLSSEEIKATRGSLTVAGVESPYRNRSIDENLLLFRQMRAGNFADGSKVLRAKIDMKSPNMNMRDPVLYRIAHIEHFRTKDNWCIYPMYDFAHPIEDAIERISHSICTLEFEDHRPLYDWVLNSLDIETPPRQVEFAKLYLTNVVTGKRYIKKLVENNIVDGWDDPRLVTISGLRRRGYTPESIRQFVSLCGVSKNNSSVDISMLEYCIRDDLKTKKKRIMAVIDPIKLIIDNYPITAHEEILISNNTENDALGERMITFSRELYIERDDFMITPPSKYRRLFPGNEVRLMHAYIIKCTGYETDDTGNVTIVHADYYPETKGGTATEKKVKGTIHWLSVHSAQKAKFRLFESLIADNMDTYNAQGDINFNPNSISEYNGFIEPINIDNNCIEQMQFVRNGYFCNDIKLTNEATDEIVFNRIVPLKSSFVPSKFSE